MKINDNWAFCREGETPVRVDLPHDAMLREKRNERCHNGVNSGYFPGGKYIYEKELTFSEEDIQGKNVQLYFEGVYQKAAVYCNDQLVHRHEYGFTPFYADITSFVKAGSNLIRVTADNSLEPNCRWYSGSGIYRNVHLLIRDENYIEDVRVSTVSIDPPTIHVEIKCNWGLTPSVHVYGPDVDMKLTWDVENGQDTDHCLKKDMVLDKAHLWSLESPELYNMEVSNGCDSKTVRFGIRSLDWSAAEGMLINGKEVLLRGGCIHADHGLLGAVTYRDAEYRRVKILKENGYNAIRCAHNPATEDFLDACDELGMLVMNEAFDGWNIPKTYHDYARVFNENWREDLEAMVKVDYNHPSVILHSIGNEVSETATEEGVELCGEMADYMRKLDSTRPVTAGINVLLNVYANMGMGIYKQKGAYKAKPLPEKNKGYREKKTGSAFFNAMAQKLGTLMFFMSKGKKGDNACMGAAEKLDILGLNYASSRYDEDAMKYPDRIMVGSETMIGELPYNWERVKKYKALIGDFAWAAWDYLGEAGVGDFMYYSYEGLPLLAGSGAIDILGNPGAEAAFQQVVWGLRKEPYLGVSPLNHADEMPKRSAWRFTDAIDSWNWPGFEGKKTKAEVYTDAPLVRLYLNGKQIGERKVKDFRTSFVLKYEPGTLKAVAVYSDHEVVTELATGSGKMRLETEPVYEGEEISYVEIRAVDEEGKILPAVEDKITLDMVDLQDRKVLGFGSARTKTNDSYLSESTHLYRGRAMAIVKK